MQHNNFRNRLQRVTSLKTLVKQYTWISVTSRGVLGSQATAALQVIGLPWVAFNWFNIASEIEAIGLTPKGLNLLMTVLNITVDVRLEIERNNIFLLSSFKEIYYFFIFQNFVFVCDALTKHENTCWTLRRTIGDRPKYDILYILKVKTLGPSKPSNILKIIERQRKNHQKTIGQSE